MPAQIHSKRRLVLGLGAVVVLVAGGTAVARAMTGGDGARYRTASASMGSVEQLLIGVGSISAVNQASVAFGVSGTVATVPVSVGMKVSPGQTLATLAATGLNQSLNTANSALATARQTLATDQASETESTATESAVESSDSIGAIVLDGAVTPAPSSSSRASGGSKPTGGQAAGTSTIKELIAQVTAAQKAVIAAQQHLDQDLAAAESALATCQNALTTPTSTPPASSPPTATPTASATATATATATAAATPAADSGDTTCLAAIAAAPTKADATKDQQTRDAAEQTLDTAVQKLAQAAVKAGTSSGQPSSGSASGGAAGGTSSGARTGGTSSGRSAGNSNSTGTGFNGTGSKSTGSSSTGFSGTGSSGTGFNGTGSQSSARGATAGPASAAQLAADQAQIDAAEAQLVVARQNLAAATLTSPLAGTVAAVAMTAGKSAGTSSTITVIGTGQSQVTTTVALADIDKVKVGDPTTVKVDGISQALSGKVSLIGILNSTSGSSTSYPVTILLDPTSQKLYDGSGAATQIQIAQVSNVLTVPSSAVRTLGPFTSVSVLTNGKPVTTRVTVGAVGSDRTQILTGLKAGQSVVLADLNTPLPTSSS